MGVRRPLSVGADATVSAGAAADSSGAGVVVGVGSADGVGELLLEKGVAGVVGGGTSGVGWSVRTAVAAAVACERKAGGRGA